ncbi:protein kinase domain-containing protein [Gemmatimonas sp.]|uniref:protein kinase domain-containing protein n=1 Tax=Gemmatimonas sp. TaxID=1962908 RepID=UPI0039832FF0
MSIVQRLTTALGRSYRVERELGAGGMATVYLAHDLKHDRDVAIKVLHPDLGAALGGERFLSEIRTTARLQHPHILPLLDSGDADGLLYYVMPLVTGETLRARLERERQLPIADALRIAREVASALDYAHRQGVIHRDIKPENILLHDGSALVADFGIALAVQSAGGARMTQTGLSLGTPQYMSPEQAMGERTIDARSDVYALGAVLYEMLAGDAPFIGSSVQAIVAKVLNEKPTPIHTLRDTVPLAIEQAVGTALAKLPADRFASAAEFATALSNTSGATFAAAAQPSRPTPRWRDVRTWAALAALAGAAITAALWMARSDASRVARADGYDVGLPDSAQIAFTKNNGLGVASFAVSRDGAFAVYAADRGGTTQLWVRDLRTFESRPLAGTDGANGPALSPDDKTVAFVSGAKLKTVAIAGGTVATLTDLTAYKGASWISAGRLLVGDDDDAFVVDPSSGSKRSGPRFCISPTEIPGHDLALCSEGSTVFLVNTDDASGRVFYPRVVGEADSAGRVPSLFGAGARVVDGRYLVFMSVEGALQAASFDPATRAVGRVVRVLDGVRREGYSGAGQFALTTRGDLVYAPGENAQVGRLASTKNGVTFDTLPLPPIAALRFDMTRDGRRLAVVKQGVRGQELWVFDVATGRGNLWQSHFFIGEPRWNAEGTSLVFDVLRGVADTAVSLVGSPDASAPPQVLAQVVSTSAWPNATTLFGSSTNQRSIVRANPTQNARPLDTLITGTDVLASPSVSPNGRWFTYLFQNGKIVLAPWPLNGTTYQVAEGLEPEWMPDGSLTFWSFDQWHWRTKVSGSGGVPFTPPERWFRDPHMINTVSRSHLITPDGANLYLRGSGRSTGAYLRVIPNWVSTMKRAVDAAGK